jgi:hypothetical protein
MNRDTLVLKQFGMEGRGGKFVVSLMHRDDVHYFELSENSTIVHNRGTREIVINGFVTNAGRDILASVFTMKEYLDRGLPRTLVMLEATKGSSYIKFDGILPRSSWDLIANVVL